MRAVICWAGISGYMSVCWRALAERMGDDLLVVSFGETGNATSFSQELMRGIPSRLLDQRERDDAGLIAKIVVDHRPDIVLIPGWFHPPFRALVDRPELSRVKKMMGMDTPLTRTWKQWFGRFGLRGYVGKMDRVIVPGERGFQYAKYLGVPESRIRKGLYGVDVEGLSPLYEQRARNWPRQFLFTGRYAPVKGIDTLVAAYRNYRAQVSDPWPLVCCGQGPLRELLRTTKGVVDRGFVQPGDMRQVMLESGVFVLASTYDPWPLVIVEACASGLPVVCTDACGSAVELVQSGRNGLTVPSGDATSLASAMRRMHEQYEALPVMGRHGQTLAEPYSAGQWATRWTQIMQELQS